MNNNGHNIEKTNFDAFINAVGSEIQQAQVRLITAAIQSPNQKIPDRKTKCVIKTHINIKQNVIFCAKLKPV